MISGRASGKKSLMTPKFYSPEQQTVPTSSQMPGFYAWDTPQRQHKCVWYCPHPPIDIIT